MKISVTQIKPYKGDIQRNIETHLMWIDRAVSQQADLIVFPELSITGYEPSLAKDLAITPDDLRFEIFQQVADATGISIAFGVPLKTQSGISISLLLCQPKLPPLVYSKKYLHADEEPYFVSDEGMRVVDFKSNRLAFSICYELSVPEHEAYAVQHGAEFYISSVAKSVSGVDNALTRLSEIAKKNSIPVVMANCIGHCDDFDCGGRSSVFDNTGKLLGQLDANTEGILVFDTISNQVTNVL